MMNQDTMAYRQIRRDLNNRQLSRPLRLLGEWAARLQDPRVNDRLENLKTTHDYLLRYFLEGTPDPGREQLHARLLHDACILADELYNRSREEQSQSLAYAEIRSFRRVPQPELPHLATLLAGHEHLPDAAYDTALDQLFRRLWLTGMYDTDTADFYTTVITDPNIDETAQATAVAALTMSLLRCFQEEKFNLLIDTCLMPIGQASLRALVGLCLVVPFYENRFGLFPKVADRVSLLLSTDGMQQLLETIIIQVVRTTTTPELNRQMRDEILPQMQQMSKEINDRLTGAPDDYTEDANPRWHELTENSPMGRAMERIAKLQSEGADIYLSSFASLKAFDFFLTLSHWFVPYSPRMAALSAPAGKQLTGKVMTMFLEYGPLCNSDRYSFFFTLSKMPTDYLDNMQSAIGSELDGDFSAAMDDSDRPAPGVVAGRITRAYIQDLYRFFNLHPRHADFANPFAKAERLLQTEFYKQLFPSAGDSAVVANALLMMKKYDLAVPLFESMAEAEPTATIYQQMGYCHEHSGNPQAAREAYERADLLAPDDPWTLTHLAAVTGDDTPELALGYLMRLNDLRPRKATEIRIAQLMQQLQRHEEALQILFRLDIENPDDAVVINALLWCAFTAGKLELADRYSRKVLDLPDAGAAELLNCAHVSWAMSRRSEAIELYRRSLKASKNRTEFADRFNADRPALTALGVSPLELDLLLDAVER